MRLLRLLLGLFALAPAALLAAVLAGQAAAGQLPLPAPERAALFAWLLAVTALALQSVAHALLRPREDPGRRRPRAWGRSRAAAETASAASRPLSALVLPDVEARVARIHRTLDAIEARSVAQLAQMEGRRPAEVSALTAFADRLSREV